MLRHRPCLVFILLAVTSAVSAEPTINARGMVATVHPLATGAGVDALKNGGNAVDAAVAAALMLAVVDGHNSGIGGGCFVLIRRPDGTLAAVDGRETAPAAAHRDMYLRNGRAQPELSKTGALASGTPGALAAYALAIEQHGHLQLSDLLLPAAEVAERGFPIDRMYARDLISTADILLRFPATSAVLLKSDRQPFRKGEVLRQPDLARTLRRIAEAGTKHFYRGPVADATARWMAAHGGILTARDFADYEAQVREPLITKYRDFTVVGFPPPSSGGIHVAQILGMLEGFDLAQMAQRDPTELVHVVAEAMKLAFADRAHWLGDADFARVPKGLIDPAYVKNLAKRIDRRRATPVERHGQPPEIDFFGKHTTHIAAADATGNWVSITATVNTTFGSKVIIPGTGVIMNNEMDDFSIQPGVPNAFGLLGAEANAIEPGKRPLSSMSPTIVLRDDQPVMTVGAAGGPTIINQVVLAIIRHLDLAMSLDDAVASPRFHHQWSPDRVLVENRFPAEWILALQSRGHRVESRSTIGVTQAIGAGENGFLGVHDPRAPGHSAGP
jgi:gamma-glutamyltranspeptidase/glutathione hydrolase